MSSKWGLWIHTLLHICFCGDTERFLKRGVLGSSWRTQQNHASGHLVDSHDLCMWTEDTWVVYHWLSLDELWADPANVTVTLAFIRFAAWLSCVGKDKSITCWSAAKISIYINRVKKKKTKKEKNKIFTVPCAPRISKQATKAVTEFIVVAVGRSAVHRLCLEYGSWCCEAVSSTLIYTACTSGPTPKRCFATLISLSKMPFTFFFFFPSTEPVSQNHRLHP